MSGAHAALEYFHVPDDGDDTRLAEYAKHKQAMLLRLIEAGDFTAYPDALRFIIAVKDAGMRVAAASSSKNADLFLGKIRLDTFAQDQGISSPSLRPGLTLLDYFDVDVSGRDFAHGKPDPELFLAAAHDLRVAPEDAIVMEDAPAGIEAAKAGEWAPSVSPAATTPTCSAPPAPTSSSQRWTKWTSARWPTVAWPQRRPSLPAFRPEQESDAARHPDRFAICAALGPVGGGMSAICMRSAIRAAS